MSLVSFIPTYATLNRKSWFKTSPEAKTKRLTLSAPHSVYTTFGGDTVTGKEDVEYILEVPTKKPDKPLEWLTIDKSLAPAGYQSSEELRGLVESLKIRQSFAIASIGDSAFDLRALAYVCGAAVAATSSGEDFYYGPPVVSVSTISPTWKVPTVTNLTIAAGLANNSDEFATLARFAALAGCKSVTLMSDMIPPRSHMALQGAALGAFSLRMFCNIVNAAQSCACSAMHVEAFFSGMASFITLHSHTDEGGFIRDVLKTCQYPKAVGILPIGASAYFGISPTSELGHDYVPQVGLGLFLEFVGTLVSSDPGRQDATILVKSCDGNRPSSFPGLRPAFYALTARFRSHICEDYGLHTSVIGDDSSHNPYFVADKEDRHLEHNVIQPFYWVEPGPLSTKARDYQTVCVQGKRTELPLFSGDLVQESAGYVEIHGRVPVGCAVFLRSSKASPRKEGYSYILSPRYRDENGLSLLEVIADNRLGTTSTSALFVEPGVTNVAQRRWITPHNPLPSPAEGITSTAQSMIFHYRGSYAEPTAADWKNGKVLSFTGPLQVKTKKSGDIEDRQCRHVSAENIRWLSNRGKYAPTHVLDLAALPSGFSLAPLASPTQVAPAVIVPADPEEESRDYDSDDDKPTSANYNENEPGQQPVSTEMPATREGPDTQIEVDPQTGRRINVPNAELEAENDLGGESR